MAIQSGSLVRRLVWLALGLLFFGLAVSTLFRSGPHEMFGRRFGSTVHRTDFTVYTAAGRAVLDGTNIYDAHNRRGLYYMYLPVFAMAMAPLAPLSNFWASLVWYVMSVAMLAHALDAVARVVKQCVPDSRLHRFDLATLTLAGILLFAMSGLTRGQASFVVTYLVTLALVLYLEDREWLGGLCLAGGIVIKIYPALLIFYFLAKRRFQIVAATALWLVILVFVAPSAVFGVAGNSALLRQWVTTIALPANQPAGAEKNVRFDQMIDPRVTRNQSVQATLIRIFWLNSPPTDRVARENLAHQVAAVCNGLLLAVTVGACWRNRRSSTPVNELAECCLVVLLMLFMAPVSWCHNYTLLIAPLALTWALAFRPAGSRIYAWLLAFFFVISLLSVSKFLEQFGTLLCGTIAIWAGLIRMLLRKPVAVQQPAPEPVAG